MKTTVYGLAISVLLFVCLSLFVKSVIAESGPGFFNATWVSNAETIINRQPAHNKLIDYR